MGSERRPTNLQIQSIVILCFLIPIPFFLNNCTQSYAILPSQLLDVPYHTQDDTYYCGPASVQMAIEYISENVVSQQVLAGEMQTSPAAKGTYTNQMRKPFFSRGYSEVSETRSTIDRLKERISQSYLSILLIWFDVDHKEGHYVVVIGYNTEGIFVNDPWPTYWSQPTTRKTGKNTFISNSLLNDLWSHYNQWALEILHPPYTTPGERYTVTISIDGLPSTYRTRVTIDDGQSINLQGGRTESYFFDSGTSHTVTVDQIVSVNTEIRYFCSARSWLSSSAGKHSFVYTRQYYLEVTSPYGTATGSAWYPEGSVATISVNPVQRTMPGVLGLLGASYIFDHWNNADKKPTTEIQVTSPRKVTAIWKTDLTQAYVTVAILSIVAIAAVGILFFAKRRPSISQPPRPDLRKSVQQPQRKCTRCGTLLEKDDAFCMNCGLKQE